MDTVDKIASWFVNVVYANVGRFLLIALLAGLWFFVYGVVVAIVRFVLDKPIRFVFRRDEASKFPARVGSLVAFVITIILLVIVHEWYPQVTPIRYILE